MIALGIEGTAHTLGIGVVEDKTKVRSDVRKTYSPKTLGTGIHPREAAQYIAENFREALDEALRAAKIGFDEIDLISFSQGPGLGPCLRTVATGARALSLHYNIPIIGVNHCVAHIEVGRVLGDMSDPLILYVSGGNTQVLRRTGGYYRIFGETLDIGAGNMLDKFGREVGIAHPAGPKIEAYAREGKKYYELPYAVKGTDLSFSGLLTAAVGLHRKGGVSTEDLCYSLQETAFSMLTEVSERALAHLKVKEVLLAGGVGNNKRLAEMLSLMAKEHKARFFVPEGYCGDNGVMIALTGYLMYEAGIRQNIDETIVNPNFRTDAVKVLW